MVSRNARVPPCRRASLPDTPESRDRTCLPMGAPLSLTLPECQGERRACRKKHAFRETPVRQGEMRLEVKTCVP